MSDPQGTDNTAAQAPYNPETSDPQHAGSAPPQASFTLPSGVASQAAPPKKQSPFVKIGLGCLGLIVLGCIGIGGFAFFQLQQQKQAYEAGHKAYLAGDCTTAIASLTKAADGLDDDVKASAKAEMQECEALGEVDQLVTDGTIGDGVLGYVAFMDKYDQSPLAAVALTKAQEAVAAADPEALATVDVCDSVDSLVENTTIATPDESLPPLLYACGQTYENEARWTDAVNTYARFRKDYTDHELAPQVEEAYVRATLSEAQDLGAGELPAPQGQGQNSGGDVTVVIQNDSPESLSIVFSGPDIRVEELEACTDCESFTSDSPSGCPELGPIGTYKLKPGSYDVVVKASSDTSVTPFRGTWDLSDAEEYSSCFYLVTGP